MPSTVPVAIPGREAGQHAPDRRRPRLAEREGRLAHVARDGLQRLARPRHDERHRDERHHRPRGQERAAEDGVALGLEGQQREHLLLEQHEAEDREHDVRRPGDHLDARLDHPRQPRGAAELDQPDGGHHAERQRDRRADERQRDRPDERVEEAARPALIGVRQRPLPQQLRTQVLQPAVGHVKDDPARQRAQEQARGPAQREPDAVERPPAGGGLDGPPARRDDGHQTPIP
jgi:hypothetical protein